MASHKPKLPPAAEPQLKRFDAWNSSSSGHQVAQGRGPQGWRESRNKKMNSQFKTGNSGGTRMSDTVGAGSENFDERLGMLVPAEVRARAKNSVADMLQKPGTMRPSSSMAISDADTRDGEGKGQGGGRDAIESKGGACEATVRQEQNRRGIFEGLTIYVNGSTHPLVSDHKLKHLLSENGARMSLHLGRRQVTHVILGKPAGLGAGAGGGLAGGKLEREIRRVGGCGVKYVGVEWVLESIKAGKRLPEARFANLKIAARAQRSVFGAFSEADGGSQDAASTSTG